MRLLPAAALTASMTALASASHAQSTPSAPPSVGYSLRAGIEVAARSFAYSDPLVIATNLRPYDVAFVPLLTFGGDVRPFVWSRTPMLDLLQISFDYAFAPSLTSSTDDGDDIRTSWDHGDVTLRIPVRLDEHVRALRIGGTLGYGWLGFSFSETGPLAAEIPTVTYRFVRMGAFGQVALGKRLALTAAFDYLAPLSGGSVYERFRDPTVNGIDAQLGLDVGIAKDTRFFLRVDYTRFFSTFVPVPGDEYVAGGALDQFGSVTIGMNYGQ